MPSRSRLVAARMRTSTPMGSAPPTRSKVRSWRTRRSLTWVSGGISPISSRKRVPPSASSKRPWRRSTAPVKAPRSWPKSSDSRRVSGSAAQLTATKGLAAPGREAVEGPGHQLLAGAALAGDEDGGAGGGGERQGPEDLAHLRAVAEEARDLHLGQRRGRGAGAAGELPAEGAGDLEGRGVLQDAGLGGEADGGADRVPIVGAGEEAADAAGAPAPGLDHQLRRAVVGEAHVDEEGVGGRRRRGPAGRRTGTMATAAKPWPSRAWARRGRRTVVLGADQQDAPPALDRCGEAGVGRDAMSRRRATATALRCSPGSRCSLLVHDVRARHPRVHAVDIGRTRGAWAPSAA